MKRVRRLGSLFSVVLLSLSVAQVIGFELQRAGAASLCDPNCFVDATNGNDLSPGTQALPFKTIQAGVNAISTAGGTVTVAAGTYTENVTIPTSLSVLGAGQGSTIVEPAVSNPNCGGAGGGSLCSGASNVFLVQANNVAIQDLTVDGDNPSLTSGVTAGGTDLDARNGIITNHAAGTFNGLSVQNVTVKNAYLRGIYASSGGSFNFADDTVDNVQADPASVAMFNFGGTGVMNGNEVSDASDAISANHSTGTQFINNTVTASGSGIHTDNAGDGGGSADVISNNNTSACTAGGYGIWTFVPYIAPAVSNNTVSGCDVGLASFASCNLGGTNSCPGGTVPTVPFVGNRVTGTPGGQGFVVSTSSLGFGNGDTRVQANHNVISGAADGVYVEENPASETGGGTGHSTIALNRNALGGNSSHGVNNTGATSVNASCNWWGSFSGPTSDQTAGTVVTSPFLISSNLDGTCAKELQGVAEIGAGDNHTCARMNDGTARCWGANGSGQLGDGTTTNRLLPVVVKNPAGTGALTGIARIMSAGLYTCAILNDGTARCWGANGSGQLGDGTTTNRLLPVVVKNPAGTGPLTGVTRMSGAVTYTCARIDNGTARCWGANTAGALGDGTTTNRLLPVAVKSSANVALTNVTQISARGLHTCARLGDGTARCWGANTAGMLGDGTTTNRLLPVVVKNPAGTGSLTSVSQVEAGSAHSCAVLTDGTVRCWGNNANGQLGDGSATNRFLPVMVKNAAGNGTLTKVTQISIRGVSSCARLSDGTARCWGNNANGQLGDGTNTGRRLPVVVKGPDGNGLLTGVTQVTSVGQSCVRLSDGSARCWGANGSGQLGDNTTTNRLLPVFVQST